VKTNSKLKSIINKILYSINLVFALLLALTYLAVYIDPKIFWPLAILALGYKIFLYVNLFFIFIWVLKKKKWFIVSLLVIILGWNNLINTFQFPLLKKDPVENIDLNNKQPIKVISYNVKLFNLFGWSETGPKLNEIISYIKQEKPDVVCFQEFYSKGNENFSIKAINSKLYEYPYRHIVFFSKKSGNRNYGIATYSKHPIINRHKLKFDKTFNSSIYTDIKFNGDTIRIFNNHLQSTRLTRADHQFLDSLIYKKENSIDGFKNISYRVKEAFEKRSSQTQKIVRVIEETKHPLIICGDFNDTPVSYTYHSLRENMNDAFVETGDGTGVSFLGKKFLAFRIDYLLFSNHLVARDFKTHNIKHSDHYPISSSFYLKKNK